MKKTSAARGLPLYVLIAGAILFVVMRKFLLFQAAYLYKDAGGDSINSLYPQILHLFSYLRTDGIPGWSFNQGLGQNIYPFSWDDPFQLILFLFRGDALPFGIAYREAAKILAAGAFFYLYLRELSLRETASLAGALLFSFSGYVVLGSVWAVFTTEAAYCALLLYAFERYLRRGSWALLPVPIALISLLQPFFLYPYALFFALYASVRFVDERGDRPREYGVFMLRFAGLAALGAAMSGVLLLSDVRQMLESPRVGGHASMFRILASKPVFAAADLVQGVNALLRLYSSDMVGAGAKFLGWQNYLEAPLFYCGLVCLLLAPQAFAAMEPRRRRLYGVFAAVVFLPVVFPFFRYAFWAFTGNYYRTLSLFVAATLIGLSAFALDWILKTRRTDRRVLAASLSAAVLLLYAVPAAVNAPVDRGLQTAAACFLAGHAVLLLLAGSGSARRARGGAAALVAMIAVEAAFMSWRTVNDRDFVSARELSERTGYNDFTLDAVAFLKSADPSFFRVEKDYQSFLPVGINDAKAQGYYGTSSYYSFNQPSYIDFLSETGVLDGSDPEAARWNWGLRFRGKLMSLAGVKYFLYKDPSKIPARFAKDRVGTFGDVTAFRNRRALPLGFTYDRCLPLAEFRTLDKAAKDAALLDAFVADGDCLGFPRFSAARVPRDDERRYDAAVRAREADVLSISTFSQNGIAGTVSPKTRKLLFFSIPYDAGWSADVDGAPAALARVDVGFMALPLEPGTHRVELRFVPPLRAAGAGLSAAGLALYGLLLARRKRRP